MAANDDPPLISAAIAENIVECRLLIDTGEANFNGERDKYGRTALHIASIEGYLEISELLTSSGADVNIRDSGGSTALHMASMFGYLEIVQLLLCQGADMSIKDHYGRTALDIAFSYGRLEIAYCLRKWPWTMAIIALKEINSLQYLDFSSFEDLWQY